VRTLADQRGHIGGSTADVLRGFRPLVGRAASEPELVADTTFSENRRRLDQVEYAFTWCEKTDVEQPRRVVLARTGGERFGVDAVRDRHDIASAESHFERAVELGGHCHDASCSLEREPEGEPRSAPVHPQLNLPAVRMHDHLCTSGAGHHDEGRRSDDGDQRVERRVKVHDVDSARLPPQRGGVAQCTPDVCDRCATALRLVGMSDVEKAKVVQFCQLAA